MVRWRRAVVRFHRHIYHLLYYDHLVQEKAVYFRSATLADSEHWPRPVLDIVLPGLFSLIFALRALLLILFYDQLRSKSIRLELFYDYLPPNARLNLEFTIMLWAVLHFLYCFYVIQTRSTDFSVVAIFTVHPEARIKPYHLGLTSNEYRQVDRLRTRFMRYLNLCTYGLSVTSIIILAIQAMLSSLFGVHPFMALVGFCVTFLFAIYVCGATYGIPVKIAIATQYVVIKQRSICRCLEELQHRLCAIRHAVTHTNAVLSKDRKALSTIRVQLLYRAVVAQNERYVRVMHEAGQYGRVIGRCLNTTALLYTMLLAYITHLLFISATTVGMLFIFCNVYLLHIGLVSLIICTCAAVHRTNRRVAHHMARIAGQCLQCPLFTRRQLVQLETLAMSLRTSKFGFRLSTGYVVKNTAFLMLNEMASQSSIYFQL